jgi:S-DNA-T family DNA segregation ATPase FtsK/SpoIIIE
MREILEAQANCIEQVLLRHLIQARVTGGTVTPRWVRFQVVPELGSEIPEIGHLDEELAAALDAPSCQMSRRGVSVDVEILRADPAPLRLLPLYRHLQEDVSKGIPPMTAVLGLAEDGAPLLIRLPSPDVAHVLVAGIAGAGKTALLQTMILSLALANPAPSPFQAGNLAGGLRLVLIDPKGDAFGPFRGLPHLARDVVQGTDEAVEALQSLSALMEKAEGQGGAVRVVVFIDELADLLRDGGETVQQTLTWLTQRGSEAGIHVVAAIDDVAMVSGKSKTRLFWDPTAAFAGDPHAFSHKAATELRHNFPVRLVGRVASASDARTATGWSGTGAERLKGQGDFLAAAEGRMLRFQAAYVSPEEIREVVAWVTQNDATSPVPVSWTQPLTRLAEALETQRPKALPAAEGAR